MCWGGRRRRGGVAEVAVESGSEEVGFGGGVVCPFAVFIFERRDGGGGSGVVEELSVESPPLFGMLRELFKFVAEFLFVLLVCFGECIVACITGFAVFGCVVGLLFGVDCVAAFVVEPWVGGGGVVEGA